MAVDKNPVDKNYTFTALTGHDGNSTKVQYCATENGTYHDTFESGDMYMKISTDGTTWSSAIKFIGEDGTGILRVTTEPTAYTTTTGGFTPAYRMSLSTVKSQSGVDNIIIGDVVFYSYNTYKIGYIDESYVYLAAAVSIRGSTGGYGAGSWVPNVSNVTRSNNDYYKSGGTNQQWDARMYSSESYSNGLVISCSCDVVATNNIATMIGLLATSKTASYFAVSDLAFGFYFRCDGTNKNIYAFEAGSNKSTLLTNYTASTVCKLEWDGKNVRYYIDGVVKRTVALASGTSYRMAASFWGKNSYKLKNVTYSPYVRGATGTTGVTTECSAQSIKINQRRNGTLDFDSQTFTCKLYRGSTQLTSVGTPTVTTSGTAGGVTATIATSNGTSTITVKSSNGGAICKNLVIIVSMTCESVTYTFEVPVMATVMGKYGGIETSLPTASASEQGNYYCFNGTAGTYTPTCVYACYRTAASTYAWTLDTSKEANMTALGDASSIAELTESNNATAFSIVKNLVANNAFIANLFACFIKVNKDGAIYGGDKYLEDGTVNPEATEDSKGFHLSADGLLQCNKGQFTDVEVSGIVESDNYDDIDTSRQLITSIKYYGLYTAREDTLKSDYYDSPSLIPQDYEGHSLGIIIAEFFCEAKSLFLIYDRNAEIPSSFNRYVGYIYLTDGLETPSSSDYVQWNGADIEVSKYIWVKSRYWNEKSYTVYNGRISTAGGYKLNQDGSARFYGNTTIGGILDLRSGIIKGFNGFTVKAGDVLLRNLREYSNDNGKETTVYSQIIAEGTIRVKLEITDYVPASVGFTRTSYIDISTALQKISHRVTGNGEYYYDIKIDDKENLVIHIPPNSEAVAGYDTFTVNIKVCTDCYNSLVAYLGTPVSTSYISPAR